MNYHSQDKKKKRKRKGKSVPKKDTIFIPPFSSLHPAQLYAQLKAEILAGEHYWFTKEEETELQQSNMTFYRQGPVEDVLRSCYRAAEKGEGCELLSSADIFQRLKKINPAAMRGANPASLAQILIAVGIERKHTKFGNVYRVVSV
jgi:hypothetical protein